MRLLHPDLRELPFEDLPEVYDQPGPWLRANFVASVDGVIALQGKSGALSSPADKAVFHALRTISDAVVVGAGTARAEGYGPVLHSEAAARWRGGHGFSERAPLVVVSRSGHIPADARFLAGPLILAVPEGVDVPEQADVIRTTDPVALVAALHERGLTRLLCEGGPALLTSFLGAGVVDELCLTTSPQLLGVGPQLLHEIAPVQLSLTSLIVDDPGVLLARWAVVRPAGD